MRAHEYAYPILSSITLLMAFSLDEHNRLNKMGFRMNNGL